ncbi:AAA family ATPase [Elizabethkingia meningoseptica]|uniref:ATP-binding protein n=1 Tax=Elizabethkingia meningoseptica TaxID=238 RepID=UPI0023AE70E6|nr:ATP-binding protein [Elizabethkingia meningoseptica]MDE5530476.1 AAA family ATPase [Elizabethkingia meningoseptica]MDE5534033.1 AAA family ATPase [Elizabethkingia meningoseptica]MDE5542691.1 AAA family ATPase [Elizabethkingia meningoseptica]
MKNIFLKQLSLYHFKGVTKKVIDFTNQVTDICGPNGSGKTTIFDAFTWLMFGKDSHDRKDFEIKTLNPDGTNLNKVEHTVEGILSIDGEDLLLKKIYKEKWVKKQGELEPTLQGHEVLCYINDVPKKVTDYTKEINELLDESLFKLITNPKYFSSLPWKSQRDILFTISGTISDAEIAAGNKVFQELLDKIGGKSLSDYKIQKAAEKKKLKTDLDFIPTRIDEVEKGKPETVDFSETEMILASKKEELQKIEDEILNINQGYDKQFAEFSSAQNEINKLISKQNEIVFAEKQRLNQGNFDLRNNKLELQGKLTALDKQLFIKKSELELNDKSIETVNKNIVSLREKWTKENEKEYVATDSGLLCPVYNIICGDTKANELHVQNQNKALETFNTSKIEALNKINEEGQYYKSQIAPLENYKIDFENSIQEIETQIISVKREISDLPSETVIEVIPEQLSEWVDIEKEIQQKKEALTNVDRPNTSEQLSKRAELKSEIEKYQNILSRKDQIERADKRKAELEADGRKLSQLIADIEKDEYVAQNFEFAKIEECEKRINNRFEYVQFKLFDTQINGSVIETCEATVDGVPYADVNTASQINAGLNIIAVLTDFYNVSAPVFIDNSESINEPLSLNSQLIKLRVTKDEKLLIK